MHLWKYAPLALLMFACKKDAKDTEDTDTTGDSDTADSAALRPLEVIAIGFEYQGGWDEENQLLENYLSPGTSGNTALRPVVLVTLASQAYFDAAGTPDESDYCTFVADFVGEPSDTLKGTPFDYDAGRGGLGGELETWGAFEGRLVIAADSVTDRCTQLDETIFPGGDPFELMDNMHFGFGFGPKTSHLEESYADAEFYQANPNGYISQYIAMNHPDGAGGFTFEAYDWNAALYIETDYGACESVDDGAGGEIEICGLVGVDADNYYIPGDATIAPRHGVVLGSSLWLEDTPNLDLSILKEGVP